MSTVTDHSDKKTGSWWDAQDRPTGLRFLIEGLENPECDDDGLNALLLGVDMLHDELLAWAKSQVTELDKRARTAA